MTAACSGESPAPPTETVGEAEAALVTYNENNDVCGHTCPARQVRTCGDVCVTPVRNGSACSRTDCASNSVCADPTASCVRVGLGYQCQANGETALLPCGSDPNGCAHDLFCKNFDACSGSTLWGQRCAVGAPEGYPCDSNWSAPVCSPCMPGSSCSNMTGGWGTCMVSGCTTDANCPCADNGTTQATGCAGTSGLCKPCKHNGDACSDNVKCCDANTHCGDGQVCCKNAGQPCGTNADCCAGDKNVCHASGTCGVCTNVGSSCSLPSECCSRSCQGGTCKIDCSNQDGKPCELPLDATHKGECRHGTYSCVNGDLACNQLHTAVAETCDSKDNDCDGYTDEGMTGTVCSNPTLDYPCSGGFVPPSGHTTCAAGTAGCRAKALVDYCKGCGAGGLPGGGLCGGCPGDPCGAGLPCAPNSLCNNFGKCAIEQLCPNPTCWMPADAGSCHQ